MNNVIDITSIEYLRKVSLDLEDWCWKEQRRIKELESFTIDKQLRNVKARLEDKERRLINIEHHLLVLYGKTKIA